MLIWQNHQWVEVTEVPAVETLAEQPFLFETLAVRNGRIDCLADHLGRLTTACPRLGINPAELYLSTSVEPARWQPILRKILDSAALSEAMLRYVVQRSATGIVVESLSVRPLPPTPKTLDLWCLETVRDTPEWLPRPKTGPWKNSAQAWRELKTLTSRADVEGVQFNVHGQVVEATRSALAWCEGQDWFFPAAATGCVTSTTAEQFKKVLKEAGRSVQEIATTWPKQATSVVVLRATFQGGAVLAEKLYDVESRLVWQAQVHQTEASDQLKALAQWRAQRSVNLA